MVSADGAGVVSHAGSRLLADLADRTTLTGELSQALAGLRRPRARHDPGRVLVDLAVTHRRRRRGIADIAVLGDQARCSARSPRTRPCGGCSTGSTRPSWPRSPAARAAAREVVWAQRAETTGAAFAPARAAGRDLVGLVIDLDAHDRGLPQRETSSGADVQGHVRLSPDAGLPGQHRRSLAGLLRPGNAGANTAADHITVLDAALTQIPDEYRHGTPDPGPRRWRRAAPRRSSPTSAAFASTAWPASSPSAWAITERERAAITAIPNTSGPTRSTPTANPVTAPAVAEITGLLPAGALAGYPTGTRVIVRRERPHPGAQLSLFEHADGWRYTALRHRHPRRPTRLPRRPPPRPRPGRGPHPHRQETPDSAASPPATSRSTPPG